MVTLRFALKQPNLEKLKSAAQEVSDPQSERYGQHLSQEQIQELSPAEPSHLLAWLHDAGVEPRSVALGSVLEASLTAEAAGQLLKTNFVEHTNAATGQRAVRAGDVTLPELVNDEVAAVFGLHGLPLPPQENLASESEVAVTPKVIQDTYKISGVTPSGSQANRQAVVEFQYNQQMNTTDLATFFDTYVHSSAKTVNKFIGDPADGKAGTEAGLDVEYIMGVAPGLKTDFYYHKNNAFCEDLMQYTSEILDDKSPPLVHSVSYGWQGDLSALSCVQSQVDSIEANFAKLAARGISLLVASGDKGSAYDYDCDDHSKYNNDTEVTEGVLIQKFPAVIPEPLQCCVVSYGAVAWEYKKGPGDFWPMCYTYSSVTSTGPAKGTISGGVFMQKDFVPKLWPSWPASSPWVTSVGATQFGKNQADQPEVAVERFGSGGGFSTMYDAFDAQKDAVKQYLATAPGLPPAGSFPTGGRATPDVSALGDGYQTLINGKLLSVGGTSAAAPAFAAMVSLLNEARQAAGKPAMGYLNPFLYQNALAFTDVTEGSDKIDRNGDAYLFGFNCTKGWDPVTGLGTPKFDKMLKAAMAASGAEYAVVV